MSQKPSDSILSRFVLINRATLIMIKFWIDRQPQQPQKAFTLSIMASAISLAI